MTSLSVALFTYGPFFAAFGFAAAWLYRWGILRNRSAPAAASVGAATETALVLGFATLFIGHITTAIAPGAMRALLADPDRTAVIETIGLVGALLFAWGVGARLCARMQSARAGVTDQIPAAIVLGLLFAVCVSGVVLTVFYRWITIWYAYISVPYTRSLFALEPATEAIVASPFLIKCHALLFMTLVASWPMAGLSLAEVFPLRSVAKRFAEAGALSTSLWIVATVSLMGGSLGCRVGTQQGHAPEQPIAFSHALHAGLYELDCQYCHAGAERSRHAGVPPSSVCMNCHTRVKTDSPEIQRLTQFVTTNQPVPWLKVHRLPDFAFFNHASHVSAGLVCQKCHGPVEKMVRIAQQETMSMGWCLDCHRDLREARPEAPLPLATLSASHLLDVDKIPRRHLSPPTDCSACHR